MCSPTSKIGNEERSPSFRIKSSLEGLLKSPTDLDWTVINGLLQELSVVAAFSNDFTFASTNEDPLGRSLVSTLLARNPPAGILDAALKVFPDCLKHNPVAFFTACRFATPQAVTQMMAHFKRTGVCGPGKECPYPWILSNHISADGAKAMVEAYPQGVLQPSSFLSSLSPLDFFLMAPEMIERRSLDMNAWTKFKLMLVAADCCAEGACQQQREQGLSPVRVILKRIFSCQDFLDDMGRARHVLWLLHRLRHSDRWVFEKPSPDGLYPLHYVLSHKCTEDKKGLVASRELVKILLAAHPPSARHSLKGRLPIHVAVENGWPCHDLLLSVFPEALDIRDPVTGLVPFQAAANSNVPGFSLDVTFELFRANPVHADRRLADQESRVEEAHA